MIIGSGLAQLGAAQASADAHYRLIAQGLLIGEARLQDIQQRKLHLGAPRSTRPNMMDCCKPIALGRWRTSATAAVDGRRGKAASRVARGKTPVPRAKRWSDINLDQGIEAHQRTWD